MSIQEKLKIAIKKLTGEEIIPEGSGRTDTGVHAYGQVACFHTASELPADKFAIALNTYLPHDIAIVKSEEVDVSFHPRFCAKEKHYRYIIINRHQRSALWAKRAWHVRQELDLISMERACEHLIGKHSFKAFCASGHNIVNFERNISHAAWSKDDQFLTFDIKGEGFLYNMVRIIVGTMVDIGKGRFKPDIISEAIRTGERNLLGVTAPADGLYLVGVDHENRPHDHHHDHQGE